MKITSSTKAISLVLTIASVFGLTGCGSSGGGGGTAASPNGIYTGTITGGETLPNIIGEKGIIYNGKLLVLSKESDAIQQFFEANLSATNTSLTGNGFRYDNISLLNNVSYNGTFVENQSATISFTDSGNGSLPPGTINLTASTTLLSKGSATSRLNGIWTGGVGPSLVGQMSLELDANGNITPGNSSADTAGSNCTFTGSIVPADTTINVYDATITSNGGTGCTMPTGSYTGLAWTEGDFDGTLILMVSNSTLKGSRAVILTKN